MNKETDSNDLQVILTHAIEQMKMEQGDKFDINKVNLAELSRRTGISRGKLRHYKEDGYIIKPHGRTGRKAEVTVLTGYTGVIDDMLRKNVTNAVVYYEAVQKLGYAGGLTQVRVYIENHRDLIPSKRLLADNELLIYDTFIRVWDEYAEAGWTGPDGDGSTTLLLMDWVDDNGDPVHSACYSGRQHGFQVFQFNRDDPDGECTDIIGHEFTHCVTSTLMTTNLYLNEYGAINESFSDICGNLLEDLLGDTEDTTWLIAEHSPQPLRCMSDPKSLEQPAFVWDRYYIPPVATPGSRNDNGGVHTNSSLLNLVAWRLNESGMPKEEQFYYWLNVSLAMTPRTDFAQLYELLPWCIEYMGYDKYVNTVDLALLEVGFDDLSFPEELLAGCAGIAMELPLGELSEYFEVTATFYDIMEHIEYLSWPAAGTDKFMAVVPEGVYAAWIEFYNEESGGGVIAVLDDNDWVVVESDEFEDYVDEAGGLAVFEAEEGRVVTLETESLQAMLSE